MDTSYDLVQDHCSGLPQPNSVNLVDTWALTPFCSSPPCGSSFTPSPTNTIVEVHNTQGEGNEGPPEAHIKPAEPFPLLGADERNTQAAEERERTPPARPQRRKSLAQVGESTLNAVFAAIDTNGDGAPQSVSSE